MANSSSGFHRQLVESAAVGLPAETMERRLRVKAFTADVSRPKGETLGEAVDYAPLVNRRRSTLNVRRPAMCR